MLPSWCADTVTVWCAPWVDSRGTQVRDWASAERHEVAGCSVQPQSAGTLDPSGRALSTELAARVYMPPGADAKAGDRLEFAGATYEVEGEPLELRSPFGGCSHVLVTATARRG